MVIGYVPITFHLEGTKWRGAWRCRSIARPCRLARGPDAHHFEPARLNRRVPRVNQPIRPAFIILTLDLYRRGAGALPVLVWPSGRVETTEDRCGTQRGPLRDEGTLRKPATTLSQRLTCSQLTEESSGSANKWLLFGVRHVHVF